MRWPAKMISYLTSANGIIVFLINTTLRPINLENFVLPKSKQLEDDSLMTMFLRHDIVADIQWHLANENLKNIGL